MEDKPAATPTIAIATTSSSSRRNSKVEEADRKSEPTQSTPQSTGMVTTKSGRASKPSTPALPSFSDAAAARPRTTRNVEPAGNGKKSQKKGTTQALAQLVDEDGNSSMQGDDGDDDADIDPDEATYCYCNSISYGAMVACDSDDCAREWFHLACVGLKVAPSSKSKSTKLSILGRERREEKKIVVSLYLKAMLTRALGSQMVLPRLQGAPQSGQQKEWQPMNEKKTYCRCLRGWLAVFEKKHHYLLSASYCLSLILDLLLGVCFILLLLFVSLFFLLLLFSSLFFLNGHVQSCATQLPITRRFVHKGFGHITTTAQGLLRIIFALGFSALGLRSLFFFPFFFFSLYICV